MQRQRFKEESIMGLRINTNIAAINTGRILRNSTAALNKSLERLSSGLRINRAADDAAGLAIAEGFRSVILGAQVAQRNAQDGINLVQTAEGALAESTRILQRIRELAVQAATGTISAVNRAALDLEVQELKFQIDDIANNTEFNGVLPLSAATSITLQVGARTGQTLIVNLSGATTALLGVAGVNILDVANANATLGLIDIAILNTTTLRAQLGSQQNRLEFSIATLAIQEQNSAASESTIRDADIARETIAFTRNQILVSAGTSILAQANIVPQTALQLLGGG
jgi:flagellin